MWDDDSCCGIDMDFDGDTDFADDALYFQLLQDLEEKEEQRLNYYDEDDEDEDNWLFEDDAEYDDGLDF